MSPASLLMRITSIREEGPCGANLRSIKRPQAEVLQLKEEKGTGNNQYSVRDGEPLRTCIAITTGLV